MVRTIPEDFTLAGNDDPEHIFDVYRDLRSRCPVAHTEDYGGYWTLTKYDDIRTAASDAETFISSVKAVVPSDPRGIRRPPLNFDAPRHTPYRRALSRTLSAGRVAGLLEELRPRARALFEEFVAGGGGDISKGFGTLLPAYAACLWLNLEEERSEWLAATATLWVDAWRRQDGEEVTRRSEEMYEVARWLVQDRQANPRDPRTDPASSLLAEVDGGERLPEELVVGALRQSLVVGMVAPPLLIGSMAAHLARNPGLRNTLTEQPNLRATATEEFIRLYAPYRGFARTVSRTTEVRGRIIEPGEPVTLSYAAANRDPDRFADPDEFRLDRQNVDDHLGFGKGRHQCVGMHLARGVVRIALDTILDGAAELHLNAPPVATRMPELGYQEVRIEVVAASMVPAGCPFGHGGPSTP
jgi:cytochrome P450